MKSIVSAGVFLLVVACSRDVPEGVYACRPETVDRDCPHGWSCRMDSRCWSTPDPRPDVGPPVDAWSSSDAAVDGGIACTPIAEMCNDHDDDCDGMIDEGLLAIEGPVLVSDDRHVTGINMVGGSGQFILVSSVTERFVGIDGHPSTALSLSLMQGSRPPALAFDGRRLLIGQSGGPLVSRLGSTWAADYAPGAGLLLNARPTAVTAYISGRRSELDTSSGTGAVETAHQAIADASVYDNWAGVRAGNDELVLFGTELWQMTSAEGAIPTDLGPVAGSAKQTSIAMAVRDPHADVSPGNPVAVVYLQAQGLDDGTQLREITSLRPLVIGPPRALFGSTYIPSSEQSAQSFVTIVPAPAGERETSPGHWYVVTSELADNPSDPTGYEDAALHVWEISLSAPNGLPVSVPENGPSWATSIAIATLGGTIRVASESPIGLATRGLGCHF